jgi:ATP-dependent exoDNAse (exonuclease V) beta subunit
MRAFSSLRSFHGERMQRTPAATVEVFIRDRMLAVQAFGSPPAREALRRLRYVAAQARTLASSGETTLRELCDWLEARQSELYYDAESAVPDSDEDAVRFLTVHGSKGLEFPIVILTGLGVATSRVGPQSVDLVPDYERSTLNVRCGDFTTAGYVRDSEKKMYEAEQKRLLYVATTRARDHLILSLYHGKDPCHATRILARLQDRPELSEEVPVAPIPSRISDSAGTTLPPPDPGAAARHREQEAEWLANREALIAGLADQPMVSPSHLSHEPGASHQSELEAADPPPEPDPDDTVRRLRRGRGGSALGRAVHAVLQIIDLATLENLDALAESAARDEGLPSNQITVITRYVHNAAASAPIQRALHSGRYWREVPVGTLSMDDTLLEGAIDFLYEYPDGSIGVVDYKTDHITESQLAARAETYRLQGEAYAEAVQTVTQKRVSSIEFVFVALARCWAQPRRPSG